MNMNRKYTLMLLVAMLLSLLLVACGGETEVEVTRVVEVEVTRVVEVSGEAAPAEPVTFAGGGDTLAQVQSRGVLKCGGNQNVPGFGYLDPDSGDFSGFDIDFCKAIAAAVLGDAEAVEVTPTTGQSRFPVLQSGEVDVLIRNTTHTISRDTALGFDFAPTTFYDGQGMMVRIDSGIATLADLAGGTVCVQAGTTTEKNLAQYYEGLGVSIETLVFPDAPATLEAYDSGACDGFTTDKSGLLSQQILLSDPTAHVILVEDMSREPLGPLTRHGDNNWNDIVSWTVQCMINAEFLGINQANVDDMLGSDDPVISDLMGETGEFGEALGLPNNFCYEVVKQVGNYADAYNRNLGPDTPFNLARGLNSLYTDGGILYPIPFR
jgi:general L-amino acid transport system substrate-binding protein